MREDRESLILFRNGERGCEFETVSREWINRLDELCRESPGEFMCLEEIEDDGIKRKRYVFDKGYLRIVVPRRISEERRRELSDRMKEIRYKGEKDSGDKV